jgi:hypothetical protein
MKPEVFRTVVDVEESRQKISYHTPCLLMGSCFAENIGARLERLKFPVNVNPFGVLYNPVSIHNSLELLVHRKILSLDDLIFHQGLWHSFYHHSDFSSPDREIALHGMNVAMEHAADFLRSCHYLVLSLGTARVFQYKVSGQIVSNCHKIPSSDFERKLLTVSEIVSLLYKTCKEIREINEECIFIFTVSPIRHWKDGATGNLLSKSILRVAVHELIQQLTNACYFPSYEIVMDDLRDYRFYAGDMIHLNEQAVEYIWQRFSSAWITAESAPLMKEVDQLKLAMEHRPFQTETDQYKSFLRQQVKKIDLLAKKYPFLDLSHERQHFTNLES